MLGRTHIPRRQKIGVAVGFAVGIAIVLAIPGMGPFFEEDAALPSVLEGLAMPGYFLVTLPWTLGCVHEDYAGPFPILILSLLLTNGVAYACIGFAIGWLFRPQDGSKEKHDDRCSVVS